MSHGSNTSIDSWILNGRIAFFGLISIFGGFALVQGFSMRRPVFDGVLEYEHKVIVHLVHVRPAGGLAREDVALHHGSIDVVEHFRGDFPDLHMADMVAYRLELECLLLNRGGKHFLRFPAHVEIVLAVLLGGKFGSALNAAAFDFFNEVSEYGFG